MNPGFPTIRKRFTMKMNNEQYFQNVDDEYIKSLPVKSFTGTIFLIDNPSLLTTAEEILAKEHLLGFDTETRPSFKKGRSHQVSLLQLSTHNSAFLFRLNKVQLPQSIIKILEDKNITKVGVALKDDLTGLKKVAPMMPDGFIDLQKFVKQYGIEDNGLKKIVANVLGFRISKKSQTSNWEQEELSQEQIEYAATDAWVCHEIYEKLLNHS